MTNYRSTLIACLSLLVAAVALITSLAPASPAAIGAAAHQAAEGQAVDAAAVNRIFNYQGLLRKPNGSLASGTFDMTFKLYSAVVGGEPLFTETHTSVNVRNGSFEVVLGDINGISADMLLISPLYLGITVGADAEMQPRQRINPVPMALTLAPGATIAGDLTLKQGTLKAENSIYVGPPDRLLALNSDRVATYNHDLLIDSFAGRNLHLNADDGSAGNGASGNIVLGNGSNTTTINGTLLIRGWAPILVRRVNFPDLQTEQNTHIPAHEYSCVTGGYNATYDVNEGSAGDYDFTAYPYDGEWWVRSKFHAHNWRSNVRVDVVCFYRTIVDDQTIGP